QAQRGLWGPEHGRWLAIVGTDLENIRGAIAWNLARDDNESALRIVTALDSFWMGALSGPREGLRWFEQCLAAGVTDAPAALRARALGATSSLALLLGDLNPALDAGLEALDLFREIQNSQGIGSVLTALAMITRGFGR